MAAALGGRSLWRLARAGYYVVVNYRSGKEAAEKTVADLVAAGGKGEAVCFDVADAAATKAAVSELLKKHKWVDVLVNNAGVVADGIFAMMPEKDWNLVLSTTLNGFYNVTKPLLMRMVARKKGSIINISSISGIIANRGQVNYSAAKAGLIGASRSLAAEVAAHGIRVNVVAPGFIETDMIKDVKLDELVKHIPMGRIGRPEEIAKAVRFLASDEASYITGHTLNVNGGMA
ncbi:MAG: 3-oxoacyl-ACP reductase FabG [Myxococcales bacterium]